MDMLLFPEPELVKIDTSDLKPMIEICCMEINPDFTIEEEERLARVKSRQNRKGNRQTFIYLPA